MTLVLYTNIKIEGHLFVKEGALAKIIAGTPDNEVVKRQRRGRRPTYDWAAFQAEIARIDPWNLSENSLADIFDVNLPQTLSEDGIDDQEFLLNEYDRVTVRRHPSWQLQRTVNVSGEVKFPGEYSLKNREEKLSDLVERAGGLTSEAFEEGAVFSRGGQRVILDLKKALKSKSVKDDLILFPDDNLSIPKHPMVVQLDGAVQTPGLLKFMPGKKAK